MKRLLPLFDHAGTTRLWLARNDWLVDNLGAPVAYLDGHHLLSVRGNQIAWWLSLAITSASGYVLLVTEAGNAFGPTPIFRHSIGAPVPMPLPPRPYKRDKLAPPLEKHEWRPAENLLARIEAEQMVHRSSRKALENG